MQKNLFPLAVIDRVIKSFLNDFYEEGKSLKDTRNKENLRFYKLPYIGKYSSLTQKKLNDIITRYCKKDVAIKLIFIPFKIGSMFSMKDKISDSLKSSVVYKFNCASCDACYIGETSRHLSTRIKEHLQTDKSSHVYKHLETSQGCREQCNETSFTILDYAPTKYQLRIKEALHIKWHKPSLNRQVTHMTMTITI